MKTVIASLVLASSLFTAATAQADTRQDHPEYLKICSALQQNDVSALRQSVRVLYGREIPLQVSYRVVAQDLRCNGEDAINIALHSQAPESAAYLASRAGVYLGELAVK